MLAKKWYRGGEGGTYTTLQCPQHKIIYRQIACPLLGIPYYFAEHFSRGYLNGQWLERHKSISI